MSVEELARETRSSIEVTRNAKGDYQWCIKIYWDSINEIAPTRDIEGIDADLRRRFLPQPQDMEQALEDSLKRGK